jgi:archaellum component FlaC
MTRQEKDRALRYLIETRQLEVEEIEKGIVLATMQLEQMTGPNADLRVLGGIRRRREELESEWEKVKRELSDLNAGILPDMSKNEEKVRRAAAKLKETMDAGKVIKEKAGDDAVALHKSIHDKFDPDKK